MKKLVLLAIAATALLTGCARPIIITPDNATLVTPPGSSMQPIKKNVAYFISQADREREVTTAGGGGDKITYKPYAHIEPGLQRVLSNSFQQVFVMPAANDEKFIKANDIAYVLVPTVTTSSSSDSLFTWPPTNFTVTLECRAANAGGAPVWKTSVVGKGQATFSEFASNHGLAGQRAAADALSQLQKEILSAPELR